MRHLLLFSLIMMLSAVVFGQPSYYRTADGTVIDSATYAKLRDFQVETIKAAVGEVKLNENLEMLYRSKDSVVYKFRWDFLAGKSATDTSRRFRPEDVRNKPFYFGSLKTLDGRTISLEDLKGKPTLINFWFTTCKPCIEEMPVLNRIRSRFRDKVHFLAITYETEADVRRFLDKHQFAFTQLTDAQSLTDSLYMTSFPLNIFLDREGVVRRVEHGIPYTPNAKGKLVMSDGKQFEQYLEQLLQ
jgi:thiol-disulfide isomerase/thioredoxin